MNETTKKPEIRRGVALPKPQLNDMDLAQDFKSRDDMVGKTWLFRLATMYDVGRVEKIVDKFIVLSDASWVPDTGRFMNAIKTGTLNEVEPVGDCIINIDSIVDFFPWRHELPTKQK